MSKTNFNTADTVQQLANLINQFVALQKESRMTAKTLTQLQSTLNGMNSGATKTDAAFEKLTKQLKNTTTAKKSYLTQLRKAQAQTAQLTVENKKLEQQLKKLQVQSKKTKGSFGGLINSVKALGAAFGLIIGVQLFVDIAKSAFKLVKTFDSISFAMQKITNDAYVAASSQRFLNTITEDFGVSLVTTTNRYIKFLAAAKQSGLTLRETEGIFRSMTKAASVLGLQTDELRGVYLALEQMLSKGKITTEELRRQLGERLPGAMGIMAASMNISINELDKMMKKGEVLSAEVLPNFAKAVELAYGIENEKKINTLVSAQNRLSNSWQNFVKYVFSDSSGLIVAFNGIAKAMGWITELWSLDSRMDSDIAENFKKVNEDIRASAQKTLDDRLANEYKYDNVKAQIEEDRKKLVTARLKENNDVEILALEKSIGDKTKLLLDYEEKIFLKSKEYAYSKVEANRAQLEEVAKDYEDYRKTLEGDDEFGLLDFLPDPAVLIAGGIPKVIGKIVDVTGEANGELQTLLKNYALFTAQDDAYTRLIEGNRSIKPPPVVPTTKKTLKDLKDLESEINNERLKKIIAVNKEIIADEEGVFDKRAQLLKKNQELEKEIIFNTTQYKIEQAEKMNKADYKPTQDGVTFEEFKANTIQLIRDKASTKYLAIDQRYIKSNEALVAKHGEFLKKELDEKRLKDQTAYYEQLAIIRGKYEGDELKEKETALKLSFDETALFDELDFWEKLIKIFEDLGLPVGELKNKLAQAKAELAGLGAEGESTENLKMTFQEILELVGEFAGAVGDIFDASFERRIENINAEIEAEEEKYDRLIDLATGEEAQQDQLRREKEANIKRLEKERLKEEQKQAKARKAGAIAEIAINTAIGISNAGKKGFLGIPEVAWVVALGALQTAAVLAQPIPKYKDGLEEADRDHIGMINDGGKQEYVERNGQILTTKTKNAIIGLKKGDTVHKDYDSMVKKSILMNILLNGNNAKQTEFNYVFDGIEKSIGKGFKKAKINNTILNKIPNNYADEESRWD